MEKNVRFDRVRCKRCKKLKHNRSKKSNRIRSKFEKTVTPGLPRRMISKKKNFLKTQFRKLRAPGDNFVPRHRRASRIFFKATPLPHRTLVVLILIRRGFCPPLLASTVPPATLISLVRSRTFFFPRFHQLSLYRVLQNWINEKGILNVDSLYFD